MLEAAAAAATELSMASAAAKSPLAANNSEASVAAKSVYREHAGFKLAAAVHVCSACVNLTSAASGRNSCF